MSYQGNTEVKTLSSADGESRAERNPEGYGLIFNSFFHSGRKGDHMNERSSAACSGRVIPRVLNERLNNFPLNNFLKKVVSLSRPPKSCSATRLTVLFFFMIFLSSCSEIYEQGEAEYVINKGHHNSVRVGSLPLDKFRTLKSDVMSFTARFNETARYDHGNKNQEDINKLMGFSDCNSLHHENSFRFGWRYNVPSDSVEIFSYAYSNSMVSYEHLTNVGINETAHYQISMTDDAFVLRVNEDLNFQVSRGASCDKGLYFKLFPYFGGNEKAPHDISIFILERLD